MGKAFLSRLCSALPLSQLLAEVAGERVGGGGIIFLEPQLQVSTFWFQTFALRTKT